MSRRRIPRVHGSDGEYFTNAPAVQVDTAGGRAKLYKTWFSPDGTEWEPQDTPHTNYTIALNGSAASYAQNNLSWTAVSGATYKLYRSSTLIYSGANRSYSDTGRAASTKYSYRIDAVVGSDVAARSYKDVTTPARPQSTGYKRGPDLISSGGWTSCTARTVNGPSFTISGYITSYNLYLGAHTGYTGRFDPFIGGTRLGHRNVTAGKTWVHVDGKNVAVNGTFKVGAHLDAGCNYGTAWQAYSGTTWNYNVACGQINYWWYTSRQQDDLMRSQPWWDESLAERDIHLEEWCNADGSTWKAVATDKLTRAVLVDWEDQTRRTDA